MRKGSALPGIHDVLRAASASRNSALIACSELKNSRSTPDPIFRPSAFLFDGAVFRRIRCWEAPEQRELDGSDLDNFHLERGTFPLEVLDGQRAPFGVVDSLLRVNKWAEPCAASEASAWYIRAVFVRYGQSW